MRIVLYVCSLSLAATTWSGTGWASTAPAPQHKPGWVERVRSAWAGDGVKRLKEKDDNNAMTQAQPVELPCRIRGTLFPKKDVDAFVFRVESNRRESVKVTLSNQAANIAPHLSVYDDNREYLADAGAKPGAAAVTVWLAAEPGRDYYAVAFSDKLGFHGAAALEQRDSEQSDEPYELEIRLGGPEDGVQIDPYEPNDTLEQTTEMTLDQPLEATLDPARDVDVYSFVNPGDRREALTIDVDHVAPNLTPNFIVYNSDREVLGWKQSASQATRLKVLLAAEPKRRYYLAVFSGSSGIDAAYNLKHRDRERSGQAYRLSVSRIAGTPDAYEPNEDIKAAKDIALGETRGTINPPWDVDCYRFVPAKSGTIRITLLNPSLEISPKLEAFDADRRRIGASAGEKGQARVELGGTVQGGRAYLLRISSGRSYTDVPDDGYSDEAYTLTITQP